MSRRLRFLLAGGGSLIALALWLPPQPEEWIAQRPWFRRGQEALWRAENDWYKRARETRQMCGWRRLLLCEVLPPLRGPLAATADSMLQGVRKLSCERWWSTTMAGAPLDGPDRPFQFCLAQKADTIVSIGLDLSGTLFSLDRGWKPADPTATYQEIVETIKARLGFHRLCPQSDEVAITQNRRWALSSWSIGVYLVKDSIVHVNHQLGPIVCHLR
jgi:hypothetical protein